jgi:hypothetical protein
MTILRASVAGLLSLTLLTAACGDDTDVRAGDDTSTTATSLDDSTSTTSPDDATTTTTTAPAGSAEGTVPDEPAAITGTVTSVVPFEPVTEDCTPPEDLDPDGSVSSDDPPVCTPADNDVVGTVLVEEEPGVQSGRKISFTVTTSTVLLGADDAPLGEFDDLAEGQGVEAWSTGMCAESYPEQCTAVAIRRTA